MSNDELQQDRREQELNAWILSDLFGQKAHKADRPMVVRRQLPPLGEPIKRGDYYLYDDDGDDHRAMPDFCMDPFEMIRALHRMHRIHGYCIQINWLQERDKPLVEIWTPATHPLGDHTVHVTAGDAQRPLGLAFQVATAIKEAREKAAALFAERRAKESGAAGA